MRFEERAVLPAPPERVWAVLGDWEGQASWMPDVAWIRLLGPGREAGARLAVRTKVFGVPAATDLVTVTVWEPPRRLLVAHTGVVSGTGGWFLEPAAGNRTSFTWTERIRMRPPLAGDLALLVYSPWQRWMLRRSIRQLSALVASP